MEFIRFAGTINTHEEKKVAKATVNVILENCTGTFYITDIMFQEGKTCGWGDNTCPLF